LNTGGMIVLNFRFNPPSRSLRRTRRLWFNSPGLAPE